MGRKRKSRYRPWWANLAVVIVGVWALALLWPRSTSPAVERGDDAPDPITIHVTKVSQRLAVKASWGVGEPPGPITGSEVQKPEITNAITTSLSIHVFSDGGPQVELRFPAGMSEYLLGCDQGGTKFLDVDRTSGAAAVRLGADPLPTKEDQAPGPARVYCFFRDEAFVGGTDATRLVTLPDVQLSADGATSIATDTSIFDLGSSGFAEVGIESKAAGRTHFDWNAEGSTITNFVPLDRKEVTSLQMSKKSVWTSPSGQITRDFKTLSAGVVAGVLGSGLLGLLNTLEEVYRDRLKTRRKRRRKLAARPPVGDSTISCAEQSAPTLPDAGVAEKALEVQDDGLRALVSSAAEEPAPDAPKPPALGSQAALDNNSHGPGESPEVGPISDGAK